MKNIKFTYRKMTLFFGFVFIMTLSCERELSDEAVFATFPSVPDVFNDDVVGLGTDFYFPYLGSKPTAWTVDRTISYQGSASMRFDVPNANDPEGNYAGAIFKIEGEDSGRNLSDFDALTFWAKASQAVTIGEIGFGEDFNENKFLTTRTNLELTTNWKKFIIPIPDPSKLIRERGMLRYSAGGIGEEGNEVGYTFWLDELKFEKLGTIAQAQPAILSGLDIDQQSFNGSVINVGASLTQTFNVNGRNVTVDTSPRFFDFKSSNSNVAIVDESGMVVVIGEGNTKITASLAGVEAQGSYTITSNGDLSPAPVPVHPLNNVKSIFSDSYVNYTETNINPGFGGSTTQVSVPNLNGNNLLLYTDNNFTGIVFNSPLDATSLTHMHVDIYTQETNTSVEFQIRDVGTNGELETNVFTGAPDGDDKDLRFTANNLTSGSWTSFDILLDGDLTAQKNNLGAIILAGGPNFILDNIYFYSE